MTTIITRLFDAPSIARRARARITMRGLPDRAVRIFDAAEGGITEARLATAGVHASALQTYANAIAAGKTLLVVRATCRPLGAARFAREALATLDSVLVEDVIEDHFETDKPDPAPSIMDHHPLFFTRNLTQSDFKARRLSEGFGLRLLSARTPRTSAKGRAMRSKSVIPGGGTLFSRSTGLAPLR